MPTPNLTASTRFTDNATTVVYYLPSIAATTLVPTRAEMNAGTNISVELNDLDGWSLEAELIDTQALSESFQSKIPGSLSAPDSSLTFYTSKTGVDIRTLLPRGTTGYVMFCDGGDVAGQKAEVYPVTVTSVGLMRNITGTEASKTKIGFAITRPPAQGVTIPA